MIADVDVSGLPWWQAILVITAVMAAPWIGFALGAWISGWKIWR